MEELLKKMIEEQQKTNDLLMYANSGKDPNELLTVEQVREEFDIGDNMVRKMFKDPELPVQTYTRPFKVTRQAFNTYINVRRDYLKKGRWDKWVSKRRKRHIEME